MREGDLERKFVDACRNAGVLQRKLRWIGTRGAPDRIVFHQGKIVFVEMKAPDGSLGEHQKREHDRLRAAGAKVFTISTEQGVTLFLQLLMS